jgi:phosphoribosylaminoimidazolecarboxamide formyltransferase/IMP cyclohydrolase
MDLLKIRRALISVSDKTGLEALAQALVQQGVEIWASSGSLKYLQERGIKALPMEEFTGNPEAFGGRMKTISFELASALLYRRGHSEDEKQAGELGIRPIDLVVCNFYPFAQKAAESKELDELVEWIDVGGPLMVRAAAKNFPSVTVLTDPKDYARLIEECARLEGRVPLSFRYDMSMKAWQTLLAYDEAIVLELATRLPGEFTQPSSCGLGVRALRYGENPGQKGWWLPEQELTGVQVVSEPKELSYNNLLDVDAAVQTLTDLQMVLPHYAAAVVIKHNSPCGVVAYPHKHPSHLVTLLDQAWQSGGKSSFGSIMATNLPLSSNEGLQDFLQSKFIEVLVATGFSSQALEVLRGRKNLRLLTYNDQEFVKFRNAQAGRDLVKRSALGGVLYQTRDILRKESSQWRWVTSQRLSEEFSDLIWFGIAVVKNLKSNAIALVRKTEFGGLELLASGSGQPNRIDALTKLAWPMLQEKQIRPAEVVLVSDAFFPFPDIVEFCAQVGIRHLVQPGGSQSDGAVIAACEKNGLSLLLTGQRHFLH